MDRLLELLSQNARLTTRQLATMLDRPESEICNQIDAYEKAGIIRGYQTLINWERADANKAFALIELRVTPKRDRGFDEIAQKIMQFEEVDSVYLMSGGFDLTVIIEGRSMREVANFVSGKLAPMEAVLSTATHFVLKKYKEHGLPLVQENQEERMLITP